MRTDKNTTPTAFISYSWDSDEHKSWVREFAARLRDDGIDVTLDQWHAIPGDQLPQFMETAVRENDYVIAVCTPRYRERSDNRAGGVGYEGDIMTAEVSIDHAEQSKIYSSIMPRRLVVIRTVVAQG